MILFLHLKNLIPDLAEDAYAGHQDNKDRQASGNQGQGGEGYEYQICYDPCDEETKGQGDANSFVYHILWYGLREDNRIAGVQRLSSRRLGGLHDVFVVFFGDCSHCGSEVAGPLLFIHDELQLRDERFEIERVVEYFYGL